MTPKGIARSLPLVAIAALLIALVGFSAAPASAQGDEEVSTGAPVGTPITIEAQDVLLSELLRMLSRAAEIRIVLAGDIDVSVPTVNLPGVSPEDALEAIVEAAGLYWYKKGEIYVVAAEPPPNRVLEPPPVAGGRGNMQPVVVGGGPVNGGGTEPVEPPERESPLVGVLPGDLGPPKQGPVPPPVPPEPRQSTIDIIPLKHADCVEVAYAFGGTVAQTGGGLFPIRSGARVGAGAGWGNLGGRSDVGSNAANWFGALGMSGSRGSSLRQAMGQLGGLGGGGFGGGGLGGGLGGGRGGMGGMGGMGGGMGGGLGGGRGGMGGMGGGGGFTALLPDNIEAITAFLDDNSLIVKGPPEEIDELRDIISILDKPVKQVEIAVKFVTITTTFEEAFGIDWAIKNTRIEVFNQGFAPPQALNTIVRYATGNLDAQLNVLEARSIGTVINEPRVAVQNNNFASVEFTQEFPYFTANVSYNQFGQRTVDFEMETADIENYLDVMPRVNADDSITMFLTPQISDIAGFIESPDGQRIPIINYQTIYTAVRVQDGESIVLGGLIHKEDTTTKRNTPLLSKIPIIGKLFTSRSKSLNDSELLIFVTPRILRDAPVD